MGKRANYLRFVAKHNPIYGKEEGGELSCPGGSFFIRETPDGEASVCRFVAGSPLFDSAILHWMLDDENPYDFGFDSDTWPDDGLPDPFDPATTFHFVPFYEVTEGHYIAATAREAAEKGILFDCGGVSRISRILVDTFRPAPFEESDVQFTCHYFSASRSVSGQETVVSVCEVVGDVKENPPRECVPFVVMTKSMTWISVVDTKLFPTPGGGAPGIGIPEPDLGVMVLVPQTDFPIEATIGRAIEAPPLNLVVQESRAREVSAGAPKRASQVIAPYKEWLSVSFIVNTCEAAKIPPSLRGYSGYCIESFVVLQISKALPQDNRGWYTPDDSSFSTKYLLAFRKNLRQELLKECGPDLDVQGDVFVCKGTSRTTPH
ncbi:MAG: hypothetical protein WB249_01360 [Candidatus Sulfotelmatobacter sp.]